MKKTRDVLINEWSKCEVEPGQTWVHKKSGDHYVVNGASFDCDTNELRIHYEISPFSSGAVTGIPFSRPISQWMEKFERIKKRELWLTDAEFEEIRGR